MIRSALVASLVLGGVPPLSAQSTGHGSTPPHAHGETTGAVATVPLEFTRDGLRFRGDVYLPAGHGPHPGVVLLHGSGDTPRNNHRSLQLAGHFAEHGYAVLLYDKRGVGASEGQYRESPPLEVPAGDALAAVRALAARPEVDPDRVGVWGVSQGGWVGPLAATMGDEIAFVISVSGPGTSPLVQSVYQREMEMVEDGWDPEDARKVAGTRLAMWTYWATGEGRAEAEAALARLRDEPFFEGLGWATGLKGPGEIDAGDREWLAHALYDPLPVAQMIDVPVLHVFGAKDRHIPVEASVEALRAAYARNPGVDATIEVFEDAGHGLQVVDGEAECLRCMSRAHAGGEMPRIELAPDYLRLMVAWLDARLRHGTGHDH